MKRSILTLFMALAFLSTFGQYKYYSYEVTRRLPILDGQATAVLLTDNKQGVIDKNEEYIVPPIYSDLGLPTVIGPDGNKLARIAFIRATKDDTHFLYDTDGRVYASNLPSKPAYISYVPSHDFMLCALSIPNVTDAYRLYIPEPIQSYSKLLDGAFLFSNFIEVKGNERSYYYIEAPAAEGSKVYKFDVFGNALTDADLADLESYYYKNEKYKIPEDANNFDLGLHDLNAFRGAKVGSCSSVKSVIRHIATIDKDKKDKETFHWASIGSANNCAYACKILGDCYHYGMGTHVIISMARFYYQKAERLGEDVSERFKEIERYEQKAPCKASTPDNIVKEIDDEYQSPEIVGKYAKQGYPYAVDILCRQTLFFSIGSAYWYNKETGEVLDNNYYRDWNDKTAIEVLPYLLARAEDDADAQFMLACVYGGMESVGRERNYGYSFRNPEKAKYWINRFANNPSRSKAHTFGYENPVVEKIISNIRSLN